VARLEVRGPARVVHFEDGETLAAHSVVLATGVSYRRLGVPGFDELVGAGVYYGSAATEAQGCVGQDVYVIGGANSAGQAAVYLSRYARSVTLLVRGRSLEASMSSYLIEQVRAIPNLSVRLCTSVVGAQGEGRLERLVLEDAANRTKESVPASNLFVFIGAAPLTEWLDGTLERDRQGFVLTGPDLLRDGNRPRGWRLERDPFLLESSVPGVFAAGDVRSQSVKRVASAVGEGAMAVTLVHKYLERA
jgi:thioredoxin reductase (NADPH)